MFGHIHNNHIDNNRTWEHTEGYNIHLCINGGNIRDYNGTVLWWYEDSNDTIRETISLLRIQWMEIGKEW